MIAIDLCTEQALDADTRAAQQTDFSGNLETKSLTFFINEEVKKIALDFSQGTVRVLQI